MTALAYRCHAEAGGIVARLEQVDRPANDELRPGDVAVRVAWSNINFKDVLAVTGAGKIMRRLPLTAGIDLAGIVVSSADERYRPGDPVIVVGCGLGEEHDGGYAEFSIVRGDWIVPLPASLTLREAMAIGTAGFTAALAIDRMEANGQHPEQGPIVVTGATGGVGSLAIMLLARRGYRVVALTGKPDATAYLERLGATDTLASTDVPSAVRPLETARWAGAIDSVGGGVLAWLCAATQPLGNVVSVGLAGSHSLVTTVMPFILRGVNLLGVNSTYCPADRRDRAWARLAADLSGGALETIVRRTVDLADLPGAFETGAARQAPGRTLVRVSGALR